MSSRLKSFGFGKRKSTASIQNPPPANQSGYNVSAAPPQIPQQFPYPSSSPRPTPPPGSQQQLPQPLGQHPFRPQPSPSQTPQLQQPLQHPPQSHPHPSVPPSTSGSTPSVHANSASPTPGYPVSGFSPPLTGPSQQPPQPFGSAPLGTQQPGTMNHNIPGAPRPPSYSPGYPPPGGSLTGGPPRAPPSQMTGGPPPINTGAPVAGYPPQMQIPGGPPVMGGPPSYNGAPPQGYGQAPPPQSIPAAYGRPAAEVEGSSRSKAQLIVGIDFVWLISYCFFCMRTYSGYSANYLGYNVFRCRFRICYQQRGKGRHHHRMAWRRFIHKAKGELEVQLDPPISLGCSRS